MHEELIQIADEMDRYRAAYVFGGASQFSDWVSRLRALAVPQAPAFDGKKLVVVMNHGPKMSRGKYAAQAIHAALIAVGSHPGTPVAVIGGKASDIETMPFQIRDAGKTELAPHTLTAGAQWIDADSRFEAAPAPESAAPHPEREYRVCGEVEYGMGGWTADVSEPVETEAEAHASMTYTVSLIDAATDPYDFATERRGFMIESRTKAGPWGPLDASAPPRESAEPLVADEHGECPNCANPPHTGDCTRKRPGESAATEHPPRSDHKYTTHLTYTGPHCAICGWPESEHMAAPQQTEETK